MNGERVQGGEQFVRLVRETPPGHAAALLVVRNGANQTLSATIAQRQPAALAFELDGDNLAMAMPPMPPMAPTFQVYRAYGHPWRPCHRCSRSPASACPTYRARS